MIFFCDKRPPISRFSSNLEKTRGSQKKSKLLLYKCF